MKICKLALREEMLPKNHIKATIQYPRTKFAEIMIIQGSKNQKIPDHQAAHLTKTQVIHSRFMCQITLLL